MSDIFYSGSAGAFFATVLHGDRVPADAVAITPERHAELLAGQAQGQQIVAGSDGHPTLRTAPAAALRVRSVLPVAFRWAARRVPNPAGPGTVMDALLAGAAADPDQADALEYMVRAERLALVAGGMSEALVDAVLELAATRPGADAVMEPVPAGAAAEPP